MPVFLIFRRPGPTDLTWEEENPVNYVYRPKNLPNLESAVEKRNEDKIQYTRR